MVICYWLFQRRNLSRATALVCALTLSACAQPNGPDAIEGEIAVKRLAYEDFTDFDNADRRVIRTNLEWANVWARLNQFHDPKPALPAIDFSKEQIVFAALGTRPSTGYSIAVTGALGTGDGATVKIENRSPGSGCGGLTVITHPVEVSKMSRTGPVVFEEIKILKTCG